MNRLLVVVMAVIGGACASPATSPFGSGSQRTSQSGEAHSVRFDASCDACAVSWTLGTLRGSVQDTALFSHGARIHLRPEQSVLASLQAIPVRGRVSWVRIIFDGEVVAEERTGGPQATAGGGLAVSATLSGDPGAALASPLPADSCAVPR